VPASPASSAASELRKSGLSILVLEARDHIGGRAWTRHEPGLSAPIELGAEFIHGRVPETFELLHEVGKGGARYIRRPLDPARWKARTEHRGFIR